jgi:hypothetical protein
MMTHLRELKKKQTNKLKHGKSVKGSKYTLTDKTLDKLQTYYGNAMRANAKPGKLTAQQKKGTNIYHATGYNGCSIDIIHVSFRMTRRGTNIVHWGQIAGAPIKDKAHSRERTIIWMWFSWNVCALNSLDSMSILFCFVAFLAIHKM